MDVSIIIVNYNTRELLRDCLESIYRHTNEINFEVIVSDNGSVDGSIEMLKKDFPQVILIENNANLGFGAANNRGLAVAKGKYVFYLNSDTILLNNAVKIFYDYWENSPEKESIGALGCNLLDGEGNVVYSYSDAFPSLENYFKDKIHLVYGLHKLALQNILFGKKIPKDSRNPYQEYRVGRVAQIIGADLFVMNDVTAKFDENIFMYLEETELEYRLLKKKKYCFLIEGPRIVHLEGGSQLKRKNNIIQKYGTFNRVNCAISEIYFFSKHGVNVFIILGMKLLTILLWCNPFLFLKNKKYFWKLFIS